MSRTQPHAPGSTEVCFKTAAFSRDASVKVSLFCGDGADSTLRETTDELLDDATVSLLNTSLAAIDPAQVAASSKIAAAGDVLDLEFLVFASDTKVAPLYVPVFVGQGALPEGLEQLNQAAHRPPFSTWLSQQ